MTSCSGRKSHIQWVLAGAVLLAGACSSGESDVAGETLGDGTESVSQAETLVSAEQAEVQSFVNDLNSCNPKFKVQPILNCVDKISDSKYVAHFGYNNKTTSTITINVGLLNRFFPSPTNRGQPTKFAKGTNNDVFTVPFNGSLIVWGVDGNIALAHRTSKLCPVVPPPVCKTDCDDKNPCTADICDASTKFVCTHKNLSAGTSCADANACNGTETCDGKGVCKGGTTLKCDDGNSCTSDKCDQKMGCMFTPVTDGTTCPVSGNCGAGGKCTAGVCKALGANCDDKNPCTADSCSTTGACVHKPVAAGTSCSDNNACNGTESCDAAGVCKAGPLPDCDDKNPCTVDACLTAGGCGHVPGNNGAACKDGTGAAGVCDAGACKVDLGCGPSPDACKAFVKVNGVCTLQPLPDDTSCNDGSLCTQKDVCKSGVCTGTLPVTCSGASACTNAGTCNPATGLCVGGTPKPVGTTCDDGNLCTSTDACNATGQCVGVAKTCAATDQCHSAGTCDPSNGQCTNPNAANGKTCNDTKNCTTGDVCTNGVCGGTAVTCAAPTACHTQGVCEEATGKCTNPNAADGSTCSDSNACTTADSCVAGACKPGAPVVCTGAGSCTDAGTCNPATGTCSGGTPKPDGTSCDDGVKCTSADKCTAGTCKGAAVVCADPTDACHVKAVCDETSGVCPASPPAPVDTACNDSNACTQTDKCSATGVCVGSNPVVCTGTGACMQAGSCDAATGLCGGGSPKPNGTVCDDSKMCTTGDVCTNGTCGGSQVTCPAPADSCHTQGVCQEPSGVCSNPVAANGTTCSDGANCTTGDVCTNGSCAGAPVVCPAPADACHTQGTCQESSGTCNAPTAPNGTSCSDGVNCTTADVCTAGGCGGVPKCVAPATCTESTGACTTGGPEVRGPACLSCEAGGVATGDCDPAIGCKNIANAADRALCEALDTCMRKTNCWANNPLDCLCGTAIGTNCAGPAANGVCKAEVQAATKTTDAVANGTLFYSLNVPSGFATQQSACDHDVCPTECAYSPPVADASVRTAACLTCEQGGVDTGDCDASIGCSKITTGAADVALCVALDKCMRQTGCWSVNPLDCLCGTAVGTNCAGPAANGACKAEVQAATKTSDAVSNGTLFYSLNVPSGFATQQAACDHDICPTQCKFP
jgi:hypothetical protein